MVVRRAHRLRSTSPRLRRPSTRPEDGFTIFEMVIAMMILALVITAFANAFVGASFAASDARLQEVAATVADTALDKARAVTPPTLLLADGPSESTSSEPTGVDLSSMSSSVELDPQTTTIDNRVFTANLFAGTCYIQSSSSSTPNACTTTFSSTPMVRVIVDVTWSAPSCGSGCHYTASTLLSTGGDSTLDVNSNDAPNAPTNLVATAGNGQVSLSWTAATDTDGLPITGYTVTYTGGTGGTCVPSPSTATTCTVTGLTNMTQYTFTVTATSPGGISGASNSAQATPSDPPSPPSSLTASGGNDTVTLSWDEPTTDVNNQTLGATDQSSLAFDITVSNGATYNNITPTAAGCTPAPCQYTVSGLTNQTSYTFTVESVDADGPASGLAVQSTASVTGTPTDPPSTPTGVSATGANGSATVSWTAPHSDYPITQYVVAVTNTANGHTVGTCTPSPATATSCTMSGLTNGTSYTFSVTADSSGGASAGSSGVTATPAAPVPTGVTTHVGTGTIAVTWTESSTTGITGYTATATSGTHSYTCTSSSGTTLTCTINSSGLSNGTAYSVTVVADSASGNSSSSTAVTATPINAPTTVSGTHSGTTITVTWGVPSNTGGIGGYTATATYSGSSYTCTVTSASTSTCQITGLSTSRSYTITVVANGATGNSGTSNTVTDGSTVTG